MELHERFTDIDYKTPKGVKIALSMSNIDLFWVNIERYRRASAQVLPIRTISSATNYRYVTTPMLGEKYSSFGKKVATFHEELGRLEGEVKAKFVKESRLNAITYLSQVEKDKVGDLTLKAIVNGMYRGEEPSISYLKGYLEAMDDFALKGVSNLDEDFLVREYSYLAQTSELTSFYRIGPSNERSIRVQIGSLPEAFSEDIPSLLAELSEFATGEMPAMPILRSLSCLFALYAIKPFAAHNAAMAYLFARGVLSDAGLGETSAYLPLEKLLLPSEAFEDYFFQTIKTGDMTYCLYHSMSVLGEAIDEALDRMVALKKAILAQEFITSTKEEPSKPVPVAPSNEKSTLVEAPVSEAPTKMVEPKTNHEVERLESLPVYEGQRALSAPRPSLSDKEVKETAKYLREANPALSKGQCLFYASHCTMGRFYTIADYKKTIKCAYETARTSMDKLAAEGFYKKLQIKNKFVYTPIKQGEPQ